MAKYLAFPKTMMVGLYLCFVHAIAIGNMGVVITAGIFFSLWLLLSVIFEDQHPWDLD